MNKLENLVSINEVAKMFNVSTSTIRKLVINGDVIGYKIGGQWRVDVNSCDIYLKNRIAANIKNN